MRTRRSGWRLRRPSRPRRSRSPARWPSPSRAVAARRTSCRSPCHASHIPRTAGRSGPWSTTLILRQAPSGRRCWLPLLVSWDPERHRKPLSWRVLTVSERCEGRRARPGLRRAGELGTRRDLCHLPEPRPARPSRLPRPPDRRAVPRRRVHLRWGSQADLDRGLTAGRESWVWSLECGERRAESGFKIAYRRFNDYGLENY